MVITKDDFYQKYRPASTWAKTGLLLTPIPEKDLLVRVQVKNAAEIGVCEFADVVETDDASTDLKIATPAADNSIVPMFYIPDTEKNREQLAKDNSKDSYYDLNKATAKFSADSWIDAYLLVPGMILSAKFSNSIAVKAGTKVQSAGAGLLNLYATVNARIGHILGQFPNEASLNWGSVMVTF